MIKDSELIINEDGSIFHLHIKPHELAQTVILVGDPGRVEMLASFFENVKYQGQNREFVFKTGTFKGKEFTALSTGIGTDNIDIVLNELDALANIDFKTRTIKEEKKSLDIVRLGTSGGLQANVPAGTFVISEKSIGFDGLLNYYYNRDVVCDLDFEEKMVKELGYLDCLADPYVVDASTELLEKILKGGNIVKGVNISAPGFYGPQGRIIRLGLAMPDINDRIEHFEYKNRKITNYEMESSAIYGLSKLLGHKAATVCTIIANRVTKDYCADYKVHVKKMVEIVLEQLAK
ncbi:MAG: nucleoside phosphorylase [Bacteroidales bacterium]